MAEWIRSSQCSNGACVEVRLLADAVVAVRNPEEPLRYITFTRAEWDAFVQGVRDGDFDKISRGETT